MRADLGRDPVQHRVLPAEIRCNIVCYRQRSGATSCATSLHTIVDCRISNARYGKDVRGSIRSHSLVRSPRKILCSPSPPPHPFLLRLSDSSSSSSRAQASERDLRISSTSSQYCAKPGACSHDDKSATSCCVSAATSDDSITAAGAAPPDTGTFSHHRVLSALGAGEDEETSPPEGGVGDNTCALANQQACRDNIPK